MSRSINIKFPISDDNIKNEFLDMTNVSKNAILSNLLFFLLTEKGQRYYDPDFGGDLVRYIFEPSDDITVNQIKDNLNETVKNYIPNITIDNIEFDWYDENNKRVDDGSTQLNLRIGYGYNDGLFKEKGVIELTF